MLIIDIDIIETPLCMLFIPVPASRVQSGHFNAVTPLHSTEAELGGKLGRQSRGARRDTNKARVERWSKRGCLLMR